MLRNHDGVITHGVAKGLRFNTGNSHIGFLLGTAEPAVQRILQMLIHPGSVTYDVGANVGFLTIVAARLAGSSGQVFAFEPLPQNFRQLERNARLNGFDHVKAKNVALANRDGSAVFLVSRSPTWGKLASVSGETAEEIGKAEVAVRRLDSVVQADCLPLPNLIKIDVEGAETEVLDGALATIQKARPILLIELHGTNAAIAQKLNALNYYPTVVGSTKSMIDSHWNVHIVAFPERCPEIERIQNELSGK
ncbi:MAG TPA: FkbM family methyltransferase [Candidatus Angelobacter sp.]|nr:FkbM family methyltransferase [Candidatus Angelobacter sp.]